CSTAPGRLRESQGLPGFWAVLFARAAIRDPAACTNSSPICVIGAAAFGTTHALGRQNHERFEAKISAAHVLACLRIASLVTHAGARLATDLLGFTLVGRASHPLDSKLSFKDLSHCPLPSDQDLLVARVGLCSTPQLGQPVDSPRFREQTGCSRALLHTHPLRLTTLNADEARDPGKRECSFYGLSTSLGF